MRNHWGHVLTRMIPFWSDYFESFAEKIRRKLIRKGHDGGQPGANEWDYGITANLFPFIKWRAAQKLMSSRDIPYALLLRCNYASKY